MKPAAGIAPRPAPRIRPARLRDVPALERFITAFTGDGTLLPRSRPNLVQHVRDFRVVYDGAALVGCGALQLVDGRLAEIRSIAVRPDWRGVGLGGRIVDELLRDARRLGVERVFCLTRREHFFARHGFGAVAMENFPHKIWNDCRWCPRQAHCDEIAMQRVLEPKRARPGAVTAAAVRRRSPAAPGARRVWPVLAIQPQREKGRG